MKYKISTFFNNHKKGFTLVETLIAITVLMMAIGGPLSIAQKAVSVADNSRDQIIAYYLAQDAIEYVRAVRDTNTLNGATSNGSNGAGWLTGIPSACFFYIGHFNAKCNLDTTTIYVYGGTGGFHDCLFGACSTVLNFNATTNLYSYATGSGWNPTQFSRSITLVSSSDHEALVVVTVTWQSGIRSVGQTYSVTEDMYNWQ